MLSSNLMAIPASFSGVFHLKLSPEIRFFARHKLDFRFKLKFMDKEEGILPTLYQLKLNP